MTLSSGTRLGPYEIVSPLGAGAMGEVYRATDSRLGRGVAVKILPAQFAEDPDRLARFEREARTVAALSHPNIVVIHDVGCEGHIHYLVMEMLEGETLRDRLRKGQLPEPLALDLAGKVAHALAAAHAKGVVHRDLKPENLYLAGGTIKILDFGLCKTAAELPTTDASESPTATRRTEPGAVLGSLPYMSPEQLRGDQADARSDIFALGAILLEMLTGEPAFRGRTAVERASAILRDDPDLSRVSPPPLASIVRRCLQKNPRDRYQSAQEVAAALESRAAAKGAPRALWRRVVPAVVLLAAVGAAMPKGVAVYRGHWVLSAALPAVRRLAAEQKYGAAVELAEQAERYLPGNAELAALWPTIARPLSIQSEPSGADVWYMEYGSQAGWRGLGRTPRQGIRLPLGWLRVRAEKAGFDTSEDLVPNITTPGGVGTATFSLTAEGASPKGMVRASAPPAPFSLYVLGLQMRGVRFNAFWMDRLEVTNRDFKAFLDAGGYARREFWQQPFVRDGRTLSWEEATPGFRDATGRPGPAGWELGRYPAGDDDLPVTGVSWFEAAAYAAFAGKRLPTIYQWSWVATQPLVGYVIPFARFNARTPVRADTPGALHRFGALNLAGNVKEWVVNESGQGKRYILGGGFDEPPYMFSDADARSPFDRAQNFGFRCVKTDPGDDSVAALSGSVPGPSRNYAGEKPVSDEIFSAYARLYTYDRADLRTAVERVDDSKPDWRVETVTFAAAYGSERVTAHVFLPKGGRTPFQALVFMPGASAWDVRSSSSVLANPPFAFLVRSGRAVILPIYKSTFERGSEEVTSELPKGTNRWRDQVILVSKDLCRTMDYLETRTDIDLARVGYFGISRGGALAPVMLAMDKRFAAAALWLPGLYREGISPEVDAINFAPRVRVPVLVLSGRYDYNFPESASALPFFNLLGTSPQRKRRVVYDTGHNLPANDSVKETLDWFDRYFGPVG